MFRAIFIFMGLVMFVSAARGNSCPAGFIAVNEPDAIIAGDACPAGYVAAGDIDTCPRNPRTLNYQMPGRDAVAIKMDTTRRTAPSLNVHIDGDPADLIWYANMTAVTIPTGGNMYIRMNNDTTIYQVTDNINPGPDGGVCMIE